MKKTLFLTLMLACMASVLFAVDLLNEDFERGVPPSGWLRGPNSDGGFNWGGLTGGPTGIAAGSRSYNNTTGQALVPDNWLITPVIDLGSSSEFPISLEFDVLESYGGEWMSVYVAPVITVNNATLVADFVTGGTTLFSEDIMYYVPGLVSFRHVVKSLGALRGEVRIAFRHHNCTDGEWLILDNVKVVKKVTYDLAITSFSRTPFFMDTYQTTSLTVNANVQNIGLATASGYTVNLWRMGGDEPFKTWSGSTDAPNINPDGSVLFSHSYVPPKGESILYLTVDYEADMDQSQNTSGNLGVTVLNSSTDLVNPLKDYNIGLTTNMMVPAQFFYYYNISQTIYTAAEMGNVLRTYNGLLYTYVNQPGSPPDNIPIQIWMGSTGTASFAGDSAWIPRAGHTKVFDGTMGQLLIPPYSTGGGELFIPFSSPFTPTNASQNIVVTFISGNGSAFAGPYGEQATAGFFRTKALTPVLGGQNRTLYINRDQSINANAPGAGSRTHAVPDVSFRIQEGSVRTLEGEITEADGSTPISGVKVGSLVNPQVTVLTNASGEYTLPFTAINDGIFAIKSGYEVYNSSPLTTDNQAPGTPTLWLHNFSMVSIPPQPVTGTIYAAWSEEGIENVVLNFYHPQGEVYTQTTDSDGEYTINLPQNTTYTFTVEHPDFVAYSGTIPVLEDPVSVPDVFLIEKNLQPLTLKATSVAGNPPTTALSWRSPFTPTKTFAYNTYNTNDFLGIGSRPFTAFIRYTGAEMQAGKDAGDSRYIYRVAFTPNVSPNTLTYTINIRYYSTAGTIMDPASNNYPAYDTVTEDFTQVVEPYQIKLGEWIYIDLDTPLDISDFTGGQVWIGISVSSPSPTYPSNTYPIGAFEDNPNTFRGDIYYLPATATANAGYNQLGTQAFGNWMLAAYTFDEPTGSHPAPVAISASQVSKINSFGNIIDELATSSGTITEIAPLNRTNFSNTHTRLGGYRAMTNYELWAVPIAAYTANTTANWTMIRNDISGLTYVDDLSSAASGAWFYALKAVYNQDNDASVGITKSAPIFSTVQNAVSADVTVKVLKADGTVVVSPLATGDFIRLIHTSNPAQNHSTPTYVSETQSWKFTGVNWGIYTLSVAIDTQQPYSSIVNVYGNEDKVAQLIAGIPVFTESFEGVDFPPSEQWLNWDVDNDDFYWNNLATGHTPQEGYNSAKSIYSQSYCTDVDNLVCLYPDNWLITPPLNLRDDEEYTLSFAIKSHGRYVNQEHISVYAIWGELNDINDLTAMLTPTEDDTPPDPEYDKWAYGEMKDGVAGQPLFNFTTRTQNWTPLAWTIDFLDTLNPAELARVRFAFRHWHSYNNNRLLLDEIRLSTGTINRVPNMTGVVKADDLITGPDTGFLQGASVAWTLGGTEESGTFTTNENGVYQINELVENGNYQLNVTKEGYRPFQTSHIVNPEADGGYLPTITMRKLYHVTGVVYLGEGTSTTQSGATVTFRDIANVLTTYSDVSAADTGAYSVTLLAGTYSVSVTYVSYGATLTQSFANYTAPGGNATVDFNVEPATIYNVSGTITTGENPPVPISAGTVTLTRVGEPVPGYSATITTPGSYTISQVPAGHYILKANITHGVNSVAYSYEHNQLVVVEDDNVTANIVMSNVSDTDNTTLPTITALKSNYPNPFNPTTTISFDIASDAHVSIDIYNIKGQKVKTLANGDYKVGRHNVVWNGDDATGRSVGSGIYFYRMTTDGYTATQKMLLMK